MTTQQRESTDKLIGVPETLTITLYARYVESQRSPGILYDAKAVEIAERIEYDFEKYVKGWASQLACVIRAREYDRIVQNFIEAHPNAVIVNLGAGLCTRFSRTDNGNIHWYEVDFPEVTQLRRKFFEETPRYRFIARSLLDFSWIDEVHRETNQPFLVLMEGVSMYLTEAENRGWLQQVCDRLAPTEVVFDVMNRRRAKRTRQHDTVSKTSAEFKWGIDDSRELETWHESISFKQDTYYLTQFANYRDRLPWWARYLSFILMPIFKNSGRIVQLQIA